MQRVKAMKAFRRYYVLFVLLIIGVVGIRADIVNDEVFHFVTREDGLSGESVSRIMPDHQGRIWLGTSDGVSLYNGKRMVTFKMSSNGTYPNYIYDIFESNDDAIYVASAKGIFEKRKGDSEFRPIMKEIEKGEAILESNGIIYVGNREGLHVYDGKSTKLITVGASRMGVENGVRDIKADKQGNVWFLSRYALNCYFPKTGKFRSYVIADKMTKGAALSRLVIAPQGKFFIGTKNNGLYVYQPNRHVLPHEIKGVGNVVTYLQLTSQGEVAVSTDGAGAFLIDAHTERIKEMYNTKGDRKRRLPSDAVYCFVKDKHGVKWFGFFRFGMCYTYYSAPIFRRYSFDGFTTEGLSVRSFYIGNRVKLIGTSNGLTYVDEVRHIVKTIKPEQMDGAHIITNIIYYKGQYYIGTYDAGVLILNPQTFLVSRIPNQPLLLTTTVASFAIGREGRLWIGTGEGIFVWDGEGHVTRYTENNSRLCGGVTSLTFDGKGNGWACSQGISLYVAATHTFENSYFPKGFFNAESNMGASRGHGGMMYFLKQPLLYYTNPSMTQFGQMELPKELMEGSSYGFLDDMKGSFWFATDRGLYRTNYQMQNLQHFGYGEGLMCQFINSNGVKMDALGNVWIGTSNGLMEVNRKALEYWQSHNPYRLNLYDIRRGSDLMDFVEEETANDERHISLTWNFVSSKLTFRVLLQDYARPFGRLYQYKLDGEKEWRSVNDGKDVELTGLMLGAHDLKIRLAGAPGTERTYKITVLPSWLAFLELMIFIAAIVLLLMWRNYHKQTQVLLQERDEIEGALMEVEQEQQKAELAAQQQEDAEQDSLESDVQETVGTSSSQKYARVKVDEDEFADIASRMKSYIEENRIYINPELKMSDLAEVLGLSSSKLSQVFSLYLKENYYEFINRYRLEEFKRLIDEGEYKKYTLTALSEKCGFKKSSFFSTFRRVEGMTPTEYMKKVKK